MEVRREGGENGGLAGRYEGRRRGDEIRMTGVESEERIREERRLKGERRRNSESGGGSGCKTWTDPCYGETFIDNIICTHTHMRSKAANQTVDILDN